VTGAATRLPADGEFAIGARVRELRRRSGMSLRALASALGISASALSQIETGRTHPSVSRVHRIATELKVPLSSLFAPDSDVRETETTQRGEKHHASPSLASTVAYDASICLQKAAEAPAIHLDGGAIRWDRISPREADSLSFLHLVFEPGAGCSEHLRHNGREIVYVIEGQLSFHVGFATHEVGEGDSFMFPSTTPHQVVNPTRHRARACWLVLG
jgi:transcriptional regulator with XRE-family HTH domain